MDHELEMDGQFNLIQCFYPDSKKFLDSVVDSIELDHDIFEEMRVSRLPFATWEMKNLSAGEVMTVIPNLGYFNWKKCTECRRVTIGKYWKARKDLEKLDVGPDARTRPWRLPVCSYSLNHERIVFIIL